MKYSKQLGLLTDSLATWRIAHMIVEELGPFKLFTRIRTVTGIEPDEEGFPAVAPAWNVFSCVFCTSVWVALVIRFLPSWIREILAISAVACIIERHNG